MAGEKHAFFDSNRKILWETLPLDTPFSVGIDPSTVCNFKCKYCAQSHPESFESIGFHPEMMSLETFRKVADQLAEFPRKIKKIHLECKGESLCNPHIAEMVRILKEKDVAESIQIISNGSLLTPELSDALIDAGLDILCISLQGISDKSYYETCGVHVSFQKMVDNIRYFYEHKGKSQIYVKNVDVALNEGEEEVFYSIFENIADRVFVEKIANLFTTVDYSDIIQKESGVNRYGEEIYRSVVCGFSFYYLLIFPNGDVRPCSNIQPSAILGNVNTERLVDIWNGTKRQAFLKMQLLGNREKNPVCRVCQRPYENLRPEDRLDGHEEELLEKFGLK